MNASDLIDELNLLIALEGDFEILTTAPGDEPFELCKVEEVSVKECFHSEGFSGIRFMEIDVGTSRNRRAHTEKYLVIQ